MISSRTKILSHCKIISAVVRRAVTSSEVSPRLGQHHVSKDTHAPPLSQTPGQHAACNSWLCMVSELDHNNQSGPTRAKHKFTPERHQMGSCRRLEVALRETSPSTPPETWFRPCVYSHPRLVPPHANSTCLNPLVIKAKPSTSTRLSSRDPHVLTRTKVSIGTKIQKLKNESNAFPSLNVSFVVVGKCVLTTDLWWRASIVSARHHSLFAAGLARS